MALTDIQLTNLLDDIDSVSTFAGTPEATEDAVVRRLSDIILKLARVGPFDRDVEAALESDIVDAAHGVPSDQVPMPGGAWRGPGG